MNFSPPKSNLPAMFDKIRNLYRVQKQARTVRRELDHIHIEAEEGPVKVTVSAKQEVVSITMQDEALHDKRRLAETLKKALNRAMEKAQKIAAEKMQGVMGEQFPS